MKSMWLLRGNKEKVASLYSHVARPTGEMGSPGKYEVDLLLAVRLLAIRTASGEPINSCAEISSAEELDIGFAFVLQR